MNSNLVYYLSFSHFLGIGPVKFEALISYFKSPKNAYEADIKDLRQVIGVNLADKFINFRNEFDPVKKYEELKSKQINTVTLEDKKYPKQLKNIPDPPICLYIKGDCSNFDFEKELFFSIVGTRKPTPYGQQITRKITRELTEAGFIIVSGLAIGIDAVAHMACLDEKGKTVAFLGCGVDIIYPQENYRLYHRIINNNGLVISEFPPGQTVVKGLFIARNRLISGLSKGVFVVEGTKISGAMITAKYALEQGKDVFAPPVPITSEMSEAPSILLKQGAKLVTTVDDILEEYGIKQKVKIKNQKIDGLTNEERHIFDLLEGETMTIDEISAQTKIPVKEILNTISFLEIKGVVEKNLLGKYQIKI